MEVKKWLQKIAVIGQLFFAVAFFGSVFTDHVQWGMALLPYYFWWLAITVILFGASVAVEWRYLSTRTRIVNVFAFALSVVGLCVLYSLLGKLVGG